MIIWLWLYYFIYYTTIFPRISDVAACVSASFLLMAKQYSTVWIYHVLPIHSSGNVLFGCSHLLSVMNNAAVDIMYMSLCRQESSFLLDWNCQYMVILCFSFWRNAKLFSKVVLPFKNSASKVWGFQFLYIVQNNKSTLIICLFKFWPFWWIWSAILSWFWFAFLLWVVMLNTLSCGLLAIWISSLKNFLFKFLSGFGEIF